MDINLKVSPAELEAKATDFKGVMSQIKTLTDDMMADVTGLSSTCRRGSGINGELKLIIIHLKNEKTLEIAVEQKEIWVKKIQELMNASVEKE